MKALWRNRHCWDFDRINARIIEREFLKDRRDRIPNGFDRFNLTKEIAGLQRSIFYFANKLFSARKEANVV